MYKAILFSTDGTDYVTDYHGRNTIKEVEDLLADKGSMWYFYPWEFVIKDRGYTKPKQRIVSVPMWPQELIDLKGKSIKTAQEYLKKHGNRIAEYI